MVKKNVRLLSLIIISAFILAVPFMAMRFSDEVNWSGFDFAVAAILLFGTAIICETSLRILKTRSQRIAACAVVLAAFILIWIELAVGVFGTPLAGS